ncbi:hypothetical protein SNEBB_006183 [Seison nebaliae]|nr:hypothetical protein SNEBB_006183 [Seison nebaliae]
MGDNEKLGHRKVRDGVVTYKKTSTNELMSCLQIGIAHFIDKKENYANRDILVKDFHASETDYFPATGSDNTIQHVWRDFRFKAYAPFAFRKFRATFDITSADYLVSICNQDLKELSNPGASGSVFYLTKDDRFIIKTVTYKESKFLGRLLPGYYMNLSQNPKTKLPKFYGLYCYQTGNKNIRVCVMNNILPSNYKMYRKFDLKGSTYKRFASKTEREKRAPTYKDLDFMEFYPKGIILDSDKFDELNRTIVKDVRVLESFQIMDYSLLLGIHLVEDKDEKEMGQTPSQKKLPTKPQKDLIERGILAKTDDGQQLLLFLGVIDILQSYQARKRIEHTLKSIWTRQGDTISVTDPTFYANRFLDFVFKQVFVRDMWTNPSPNTALTLQPKPITIKTPKKDGDKEDKDNDAPPDIIQSNSSSHQQYDTPTAMDRFHRNSSFETSNDRSDTNRPQGNHYMMKFDRNNDNVNNNYQIKDEMKKHYHHVQYEDEERQHHRHHPSHYIAHDFNHNDQLDNYYHEQPNDNFNWRANTIERNVNTSKQHPVVMKKHSEITMMDKGKYRKENERFNFFNDQKLDDGWRRTPPKNYMGQIQHPEHEKYRRFDMYHHQDGKDKISYDNFLHHHSSHQEIRSEYDRYATKIPIVFKEPQIYSKKYEGTSFAVRNHKYSSNNDNRQQDQLSAVIHVKNNENNQSPYSKRRHNKYEINDNERYDMNEFRDVHNPHQESAKNLVESMNEGKERIINRLHHLQNTVKRWTATPMKLEDNVIYFE